MVSLIVCWCLSFYLLLHVTRSFNIPAPNNSTDIPSFAALPENELGVFSMVQYNTQYPFDPVYSLRFDHLKVSNAKLGLFNTALCKQITLQNVSFGLHSYTETPPPIPHKPVKRRKKSTAPVARSIPQDNKMSKNPTTLEAGFSQLRGQISDQLNELLSLQDTAAVSVPDVSQTIHLNINKFHFDWYLDSQTRLSIQCNTALFGAESTDQLALQGAVKITTPNGSIQTNHVIWDIQKQLFHVKGNYVLTKRDQKQFGKDICFDENLAISTDSTELKKGDLLCRVYSF